MYNNYNKYYLDQVQYGGELPGFAGVRFQRGHGFFGRLFSGIGRFFMKDLLPNVAKSALPSAINLAQDVISGQNVGQAARSRFGEAGKSMANQTLDTIKSRLNQKGSGIIKSNLRRVRHKTRKVKKIKRKSKRLRKNQYKRRKN